MAVWACRLFAEREARATAPRKTCVPEVAYKAGVEIAVEERPFKGGVRLTIMTGL